MTRPRTRSARSLPVHRLRRRPPFFAPVPLRTRRDGWTVARQCAFLAQLYLTGSVRTAAARVGMSRASAYRLRARGDAAGFAQAWDHVLTPPSAAQPASVPSPGQRDDRPDLRPDFRPDFRKVTLGALFRQLETGLVKPVFYRGQMRGIREKADNSVLFRLLRRADALAARGERMGAGEAAGISKIGVVSVTRAGGETARATGSDRPPQHQPVPRFAHGNGTNRSTRLTARAECGPSRQTHNEGSA